MTITAQQYDRICQVILQQEAKERCVEAAARRDKTEWELGEILRKEDYPPHVIEEALVYMKEKHYTDDKRYAVYYIQTRQQEKSHLQLVMHLREKGIREDVISQAFEEIGEADPSELIRKLIRKKGYDPLHSGEDEKARLYQQLLRKGFRYEQIRQALEELEEQEHM